MTKADFAFLFWGCGEKGYTYDITKAGKYTEQESEKILRIESMSVRVLCSVADEFIEKAVVDNERVMEVIRNTTETRTVFRVEKFFSDFSYLDHVFLTVDKFKHKYSHIGKLLRELNEE